MAAMHRLHRTAAALLGAAMSIGGATAAAEPLPDSGPRAGKEMELRVLAERLALLERRTVAADATLAARHQRFRHLVLNTMQDDGYPAMAEMRALYELRNGMMAATPGTDDYARLAGDYQRRTEKLMAAEQAAMANPKVRAEREALVESTLDAMRRYRPESAELLARFETLREEVDSEKPESESEFAGFDSPGDGPVPAEAASQGSQH